MYLMHTCPNQDPTGKKSYLGGIHAHPKEDEHARVCLKELLVHHPLTATNTTNNSGLSVLFVT